MSIYLGGMMQEDEQIRVAKDIAAQQAKAAGGEGERKGRSKLLGNIGGWLAGEGLWTLGETLLAGATGGSSMLVTSIIKALKAGGKATKLAKAVIKGGSMWATKGAVDKATKGKWG